ncbi:MAG: extracellular solute-binding protein [Gemmatimonadota bacterium]
MPLCQREVDASDRGDPPIGLRHVDDLERGGDVLNRPEAAPELDGAWNVTTVPSEVAGTSLFAGSNMAVWNGTEHVDGALALLEHLADPATQLEWFELTGELPTVTAALEDPALAADPMVEVYAAQLADARPLPLVPNWDGGVGAELLNAINAIVLNGTDRTEALEALAQATAGVSTE